MPALTLFLTRLHLPKYIVCWWSAFCILVGLLSGGCARGDQQSPSKSGSVSDAQLAPDSLTALDKYVAAPDTNYSFHLVRTLPAKDQTTFTLEMTSQAWLTTNEVDRPLWKHWLNIVHPKEVTSSKALLFITGGKNDNKPPKPADETLAQIAVDTKSIVAELRMVPNQPLVFAGETEGRLEDSFIA